MTKSVKRQKQRDEIVGYVIGKKSRLYPKRMTSAPWDREPRDEYERLRAAIYSTEAKAQRAAQKATKFNPVGFDVYPIYNPITIVD